MNNYEKIYWLTRLDSIGGILLGAIIVSLVALVIYAVIYFVTSAEFDDDDLKGFENKYGKYKRISIWVICIAIPLKSLIPTQNEAIMIAAGGSTLNYVQSDSSLNKLPYQATDLISKYMDKKITELEKSK